MDQKLCKNTMNPYFSSTVAEPPLFQGWSFWRIRSCPSFSCKSSPKKTTTTKKHKTLHAATCNVFAGGVVQRNASKIWFRFIDHRPWVLGRRCVFECFGWLKIHSKKHMEGKSSWFHIYFFIWFLQCYRIWIWFDSIKRRLPQTKWVLMLQNISVHPCHESKRYQLQYN